MCVCVCVCIYMWRKLRLINWYRRFTFNRVGVLNIAMVVVDQTCMVGHLVSHKGKTLIAIKVKIKILTEKSHHGVNHNISQYYKTNIYYTCYLF